MSKNGNKVYYVCSVLLATDGLLEPLFPNLIKKKPINIHVVLARFFMDNRALRIDELGEDMTKARIENFIRNIPDEQVNDDKTLVVLVNTSIESKLQSDDYYNEPDWSELKRKHDEEWKRLAYPHLFKEDNTEPVAESDLINAQNNNNTERSEHKKEQFSVPSKETNAEKNKKNQIGSTVITNLVKRLLRETK